MEGIQELIDTHEYRIISKLNTLDENKVGKDIELEPGMPKKQGCWPGSDPWKNLDLDLDYQNGSFFFENMDPDSTIAAGSGSLAALNSE